MRLKQQYLIKVSLIAAPLLTMLMLFTRGFFDSSLGYPDADRILMDGVFIADFLSDCPIDAPLEYAAKYYAQYPALSIGYRPPFFPFIEAIFFLIFGVYSWAGRLALIAISIVGGSAFFTLVNRMYGNIVASIATTLLASLPFIVQWSWYTMAEVPLLSMILITAYCVWRYAEGDSDRFLYLSAIAFALTLWTKQTAAFMLIWLLPYVLIRRNWREVLGSKSFWIASSIFLFLTIPLMLMTLWAGDLNIGQSIGDNPRGEQVPRWHWDNLKIYAIWLFKIQLTLPVSLLSAIGLYLAIREKDRNLLFFGLLVMSVFVFFTKLNDPHVPRYTICWLPAFVVFAALPWYYLRARMTKIAYVGMLGVAIWTNISIAYSKTPQHISGFEEAAQYAVIENKTPSILVDAHNNGYFTFFVRQHNPRKNLFVMRGDKLFSSSAIKSKTWLTVHAHSEQDIFSILNKTGVGLIVVEESDYTKIPIHEYFREVLKSERFTLRKRIPIKSNLPRYRNQSILIYEYMDLMLNSKEDFEIQLPIIGKKIVVPAGGEPTILVPLNDF